MSAVITVLLCGCGKSADGISLNEGGKLVISIVSDKVNSETYKSSIDKSMTDESESLLTELRKTDFSKVESVYGIELPDNDEYVLNLLGIDSKDKGDITDLLMKDFRKSAYTSLSSIINMKGEGTSSIAISALFNGNSSFECSDFEKNIVYLYTFKSGTKLAVSFVGGEQNSVYANGSFVFSDTLSTESIEDLQSFLQQGMYQTEYTFTVTKIK